MSRWLRPLVVGAPTSFKRDSFLTKRQTSGLCGAAYGMHVLVASEQGRSRTNGIPSYRVTRESAGMNIRMAVAILIGVVVVVMIIVLIYQRQRTTRLQRQFGPKYDRLLATHRSRRRVEAELEARCQRVKALHLHELDAAKRGQLSDAWESAQARFADSCPRLAA